jgi:putative flavoprotein involved in K+ transport
MTMNPGIRIHYPVIIIGGGQAGLSMSWLLKRRGVAHVVIEKRRVAEAWRTKRWDSFCLVTPNWQCQLPGFHYAGPAPDGFMKKEEIVQYIEDFVRSFDPPLRQGVAVQKLRRHETGAFELSTDMGDLLADQIVVATGGYHIPVIPRIGERLPSEIAQLHSSEYRNPESLPEGAALVVGTGQSGCQIAEDLHLAGRKVHLCVGGAPRTARRYRGKDVVAWLDEMGYYRMPIHEHPQKDRVRAKANHYVTGRDGGRDIDLRKFALEGMKLYGRLKEIEGATLRFAPDLKQNLDQADSVAESIKATIDKYIAGKGIDAPVEAPYQPLWQPDCEPAELDCREANIRSVIWSTGYRTDYTWIELPVFDGKGYPAHERGVTPLPGLYFLGLPWQYTWGSGRFSGVAADAEFLAGQIEVRAAASPAPEADASLNELALGS